MSLKKSESPSNSLELIQAIRKVYNEYPTNKINQMCITFAVGSEWNFNHHGCNDYKTPQMGEDKLNKQERFSVALPVPDTMKIFVRKKTKNPPHNHTF